MKRGWRSKTSFHNDSVPISRTVMAYRAIDVVALLSSLQNSMGDRKWEGPHKSSFGFSCVEMFVNTQMISRYGPGNQGAGRLAVFEKCACFKGINSGLILHVVASGD